MALVNFWVDSLGSNPRFLIFNPKVLKGKYK